MISAELCTFSRLKTGLIRSTGRSYSSRFYTTGRSLRNASKDDTVTIGGVTKVVKSPQSPHLVPKNYLPKEDSQLPKDLVKHFRWMMQKDELGQDIFLIGRPSPLRRSLVMQYLELTGRELEYVALTRDTTETDLKQRREIRDGTAHYVDQSAVLAASHGRVLVLEGIEKAERNVLPVLNNLLENREMHLEDGRLLIPASRYDKLIEEEGHTKEELDRWQLVRVSDDFRVIALGLPVPQYLGNPLDPPLRSRFQARDVRHLSYQQQLQLLQNTAPNVDGATLSQILSFSHTLVTDESSNLGLPDFPVDNLPSLVQLLNSCPNLPPLSAIERLYPFQTFLPKEGIESVQDTLTAFQLNAGSAGDGLCTLENVRHSPDSKCAVDIAVDGTKHTIEVPSGKKPSGTVEGSGYVPTFYHDSFVAELMLSHAVKDFCVIGPKGCGKSMLVDRMGHLLGYDVEHILLYQDMTARDLLQQRTTTPNGDTVWTNSALVSAALEGKMTVLDGVHRLHRGTMTVLHRLLHDRELQLYDGTRLVREDRFEALRKDCGNITAEEMNVEKKIFKIDPNFRVVALAEPPSSTSSGGVGSGGGSSQQQQWLTPEVLSMFLFHTMRPLSQREEQTVVLGGADKKNNVVINDVIRLAHVLRSSPDAQMTTIANSLSTRQLLRIARRSAKFPGQESSYEAVQKACLTRFLPSLPKDTLTREMSKLGMERPDPRADSTAIDCIVENDKLRLGRTEVDLYKPTSKTKIPETLFYDTPQNLATMEAILQDFLLGEHILLVGNQGVGKNKLVDRLLNLMNRPREYIQLHRDTTVQSLTLQPTVKEGVIVYEDSPLVKAVKSGSVLVIDEADKAPTHVTCILKTLVESGEMILSDGRRIVRKMPSFLDPNQVSKYVEMHPDFRTLVLANRPGFPFLGNDFFAALGDLFACHAVDNPSLASEISMLKKYGPSVPDETLQKLVGAFSELRQLADDDQIQYPYSTREAVNVVKHLEKFPDDGLSGVVRNVFDFDAYSKETREALHAVLQKHGIPIGLTSNDIRLAREFPLPNFTRFSDWQVSRIGAGGKHYMALPVETSDLVMEGPSQTNTSRELLDRTQARGLGFTEMQSYWTIPFHDSAVVGDICVDMDKHGRQLYDRIHVATTNPVWLYSMRAVDDKITRIMINQYFDTRRSSISPKVRLAVLGKDLSSAVAVHDEVSNNLILAEPESGQVLKVQIDNSILQSITDRISSYRSKSNSSKKPFYRMLNDFSREHNELLFYTPDHNAIELITLDTSAGGPKSHKLDLPFNIKSLHPLSRDQYLIVAHHEADRTGISPRETLFTLKKTPDGEDPLPTLISPITQTSSTETPDEISSILMADPQGLTDYGLSRALKATTSTPNTLLSSRDHYAALVMGFPELEFSPSEVVVWPRAEPLQSRGEQRSAYSAVSALHKKYEDASKNLVMLRESCQVVRPVSYSELPEASKKQLQGPSNITAYLEVVDLMDQKLRYVPVPEPSTSSNYASWYKYTYPEQASLALAQTSNEGLVTVDNSGTLRLWETGVANLGRSLAEWRRMVAGGGEEDRDLMIERNKVGELDSPKHGKVDPTGAPHVGGNTWAGGTGGRDTAGLGGVGGPYRLDAGHDVHQVSDDLKDQVPEHIKAAAREMNRKAYSERLREIRMSEYDAELYEQYAAPVRKHVQTLRLIINGLQARAKDRQWLKNQTSGELDDTRLIEGITGERTIYKKRGEQEPEPGAPQEKPKRLRLVVDCSGSMYRFNGHDSRLERSLESALMVMEALDGHGERLQYDIYGHSGEESDLPFVKASSVGAGSSSVPSNERERLQILRNMHAHAQFCMSGDHTLAATVQAINEVAASSENYDESFVIVLSDANFDRYGISPSSFSKILTRNDKVNAFAIFIGSLGDQADRLTKQLPAGKGFVCLETRKLPEILKAIFTSTMLK